MTKSFDYLLGYEEIITDFRALVKLVLHASETTEPEEWGAMRDTTNTSFYLMLEMLQRLENNHTMLWNLELIARRAERGEHPH